MCFLSCHISPVVHSNIHIALPNIDYWAEDIHQFLIYIGGFIFGDIFIVCFWVCSGVGVGLVYFSFFVFFSFFFIFHIPSLGCHGDFHLSLSLSPSLSLSLARSLARSRC